MKLFGRQNQKLPEDFEKNWPASYYEESSPEVRKEMLEVILKKNPDSVSDQRRKRIYVFRYGKGRKHADAFLHAWLMIKIMAQDSVNLLNRNAKKEELRSHMQAIGLLDDDPPEELKQEWKHFARTVIETNASDRTYGSTVMGLVGIGDENTIIKLMDEINAVTKFVPDRLGMKKEMEELREIFHQTFTEMVQNGETYWKE